jgi:hypothetical protein
VEGHRCRECCTRRRCPNRRQTLPRVRVVAWVFYVVLFGGNKTITVKMDRRGRLLVIFDVLSISRKLKAWLKKSKVESLLQVLKVTKMDPGAPGPLDTDTVKWKVILFFAAKGSVRQLNILLALNEITQ